jgi:ATP-dependent DNA helicase RecG
MSFKDTETRKSLKEFDARKLMEIAVETMKSSRNEPRDDGKISPSVGAVIWDESAKRYETASRGELREGDHAEFGLLERKNRDRDLEGFTLFATLEPCAPGARNHPKLGCAERIVNARISKVYIGIEDPDPTVDRKGIKHLEDNGIEIQMFDRDLQDEIRQFNEDFLQQAIARGDEPERESSVELSPLERPVEDLATNDFSDNAINRYCELSDTKEVARTDAFWRHFAKLRVLAGDRDRKFPTGFGLILFGSEPRLSLPQAGLMAKAVLPGGQIDSQAFEGPMVLIPSAVEAWVRKVMPVAIDRTQTVRTDDTLFPWTLMREGIINALVHRDYDIKGAKVQLEIDNDSVVIKSPGRPVSPLTIEQLQTFSAPNLSRNPILHLVLSRMKMAEERGFGMHTWRSIPQVYGLQLPTYEFEDPYLILKFSRKPVIDLLNDSERKAWDWVQDQAEDFTSADYMKALSVGDRTARNHLGRLREVGLLDSERVGRNEVVYRARKPGNNVSSDDGNDDGKDDGKTG